MVRAQQDRLFGEDVRALAHLFRVARELGADEETIKAAWSGGLSATDLVWRELDAAEHPWLLVLDNADEPAWLAAETGVPGDGTGWLRSSRAGLTVVTSRVGSPGVWGHEADTHRIGVLSPADGRDVLLDLAGEAGDPAEAQVLAERLDGLPLALKLAGSYLARSARGAGLLRHRGPRSGGRLRSFATYTEALGEAGAGFLDQGEHRRLDEAGTERMHRSLVGRTWELSLDLLEEQRLPEARFLMRLLSCCAPAPFPVELLDSETLPSAAEPDQADRALEALIDLSLVDVVDIAPDGEGAPVPCLVSHRLVLEANALRLADSAAGERRVIWRAIARILEGGTSVVAEQPANWPWWRLLGPHIAAALAAAPDTAPDTETDEEVLLPLLRAGLAAFAFYVFAGSDTAGELARLLALRGAALAPDHPVRLSVRHRVAITALDATSRIPVTSRSDVEADSQKTRYPRSRACRARFSATVVLPQPPMPKRICALLSPWASRLSSRSSSSSRPRTLDGSSPYGGRMEKVPGPPVRPDGGGTACASAPASISASVSGRPPSLIARFSSSTASLAASYTVRQARSGVTSQPRNRTASVCHVGTRRPVNASEIVVRPIPVPAASSRTPE
ncbi:hypothetical protein [Streptomyces sp. NBC_01508]|uniref:hypothetical protein n=1 Tax=Streptomyces sp. NBC_01508 TaxID=2903888 RepID=UPI00386E4C67